jgi:hypothetical protein
MSITSSAGLVMGITGLPSDIPVVVTANNIATRLLTPLSDIVNLRRRSCKSLLNSDLLGSAWLACCHAKYSDLTLTLT